MNDSKHTNECRFFEEHLEALLMGELGAAETARAEAHGARCARCGRLLGIVRGETANDEIPQGGAFMGALLERTVGSACARAEFGLCDWVDDALDATESDLVAMHVEHCAACAALARALRALPRDLAAMAEIDPGPEFTRAVVAHTHGVRAGAAPSWMERLRDQWQALLLRPRAAMELATAGCFVLLLLCGLPFSPMRDVPRQALHVAQINPVAAATSSFEQLEPLWNDYGAPTWNKSGGRLVDGVRSVASEWAASRPRATEAWNSMGKHTADAGRALWQRDGERFSQSVHALADDIELLWDGLRSAPTDTLRAAPQPSEE